MWIKSLKPKALNKLATVVLEALVDTVLEANADIVEEYRSGKDKAFNSLVGRVMREAKVRLTQLRLMKF